MAIISYVAIFAAICLLVFIFLKVKPFRYQALTVVSLSVFIFTTFVFLLIREGVFYGFLHGSEKEMLMLVDEGQEGRYSDTEIIDGQTYRKIVRRELHTWAEFLFGLLSLTRKAALFTLAWIAINIRIEGSRSNLETPTTKERMEQSSDIGRLPKPPIVKRNLARSTQQANQRMIKRPPPPPPPKKK